jgi:DnaJ family protein C protein 13
MLRAQCILFRRYAAVLAPFKYAGYPQLLEVLRQQQVAAEAGASGKASTEAAAGAAGQAAAAGSTAGQGAVAQQPASVSVSTTSASSSGHFLSGERISQVLAAIELCWLTCVASRRNAEELLRSGGLPLLAGLLTRCARCFLAVCMSADAWSCL